MNKWVMAAVSTVAIILAGDRAQAANCATVTFSPATVNFGTTWNPITPAQQTISVTATVTRNASTQRSYRLILIDNTNEASPVIGSSGPSYQVLNVGTGSNNILYKTGTSITTLSTTAVSTVNLANGNGGDSVQASLSYVVPANGTSDYVGGTAYTENLSYAVQCYTANNGGGTSTSDGPVAANSVTLTIPKLASITTASPQTINFGSFTTTTQTLQVGLKSTSSINVTVANGGQMILTGAVSPYPTNSVIPYTMTLNGTSVANGTSLTNQTRAGVGGTNWPLILTLQNNQLPAGKLAGSYSDTITLTVTPGA